MLNYCFFFYIGLRCHIKYFALLFDIQYTDHKNIYLYIVFSFDTSVLYINTNYLHLFNDSYIVFLQSMAYNVIHAFTGTISADRNLDYNLINYSDDINLSVFHFFSFRYIPPNRNG